jgi:hypothetical protein
MSEAAATRRSFISTAVTGAAVVVPLALLGGCGSGSGSASGSGLLSLLTGKSSASASSEADIWKSAVGQSFRIGTTTGPVYASLTSVIAQPAGERPGDLRQEPLLLSFTLDAGYDAGGDETYFLDRMMANESRLFMQRGTSANGRPELLALLN